MRGNIVTCKKNGSIRNAKIEVTGKVDAPKHHMTRDQQGKGQQKSTRDKRENGFLKDYI